MSNPISETSVAIKTVLRDQRYLGGFIVLAAAIFSLLFYLQIVTTPGNSAQFQMQLYGFKDWFLLITIAMTNALFVVMQIYIIKLKKMNGLKSNATGGGLL